MSDGVSEDLFRRQMEVTAQLAGNLTDQSRTLAQVVEIQRDLLTEASKANARLDQHVVAVETIEERIHDSEKRIVAHASHQAERLEFWKKPVPILIAFGMAFSSLVDGILKIVAAMHGSG